MKDLMEHLKKAKMDEIGFDYTNEEACLRTVKGNGYYYIKFIPNPSEEVCLEAIKQDAHSIQYMKNPSEAVQLAAVTSNWHSLCVIDNPTEKVIIEAIKQNKKAIGLIDLKFLSEATKEILIFLI